MGHLRQLCSFDLVLTSRCNLRCAYCYQTARSERSMSPATVRAAVTLLLASQRRPLTLALTGGEPLLEYPLVRLAVDSVRARDPAGERVRLIVRTNGLLLDPEVTAYLTANRVRIQLSFDGVEAAQDRRGPGTFPILDRRLGELLASHPETYRRDFGVSLSVTPSTVTSLAASTDYLLERGVADIAIGPVRTLDEPWPLERIEVLDEQFRQIVESSLRHHRRTGQIPVAVLRAGEPADRECPSHLLCGIGRGEALTVGVDGQVHGCVTFVETRHPPLLADRLRGLELAPLGTAALEERLAGFDGRVREARIFDARDQKHSAYGRCRDCRFLDSCAICPVAIGWIPGNRDPDRMPDFHCAFNRVALAHREGLAARLAPAAMPRVGGELPLELRRVRAFARAVRRDRQEDRP